MGRTSTLLAIVLALAGTPAAAHHSVAGSFDTKREVAVEGIVAEFHYVNPHPFLLIDATSGGAVPRWRLEMDNRSELEDAGITATTFRPGERVIVRGNPAYGQAQTLYIVALERPSDGFRFAQVNDSPRVISRPR